MEFLSQYVYKAFAVFIILAIMVLIISIWMFIDAYKCNSKLGIFLAIANIFSPVIPLIIYFIVKPKNNKEIVENEKDFNS